MLITITAGDTGKDRHCHFGERDNMRLAVLCPLTGKGDCSSVKVYLIPTQAADFVAAATGQQQQFVLDFHGCSKTATP